MMINEEIRRKEAKNSANYFKSRRGLGTKVQVIRNCWTREKEKSS